MSQIQFFGVAPSIAEAARRIDYSRQTLHAWRKRGCPAFLEDGKVDLSQLREWLNQEGLGIDEGHNFGCGLSADTDLNAPGSASHWAGGRDYAFDLDSVRQQAFRFGELLEDDGHEVAAKEFDEVWDRCDAILRKFEGRLEELGLCEKLDVEDN